MKRLKSELSSVHGTMALEAVWHRPWVRVMSYVVLLAGIMMTLWSFRHAFAFAVQVGVIGFFLAYLLQPVVRWFCLLRLPRGLAVVLVYLMVLSLFTLGSVLVAQVIGELERLVHLVPTLTQALMPLLESGMQVVEGLVEDLPDWVSAPATASQEEVLPEVSLQEYFARFLEEQVTVFTAALRDIIANAGTFLFVGVTGILSTTMQVFFILLASVYFLYDFPRITKNSYRYVPARFQHLYGDLLYKTDRTVGGYLRGQLLITTILGVIIWLGLTLVGVPLALAISFLAAIFNLVPYLGPIIGIVPAVLLGLTVSPLTALLAVGVFVVANQLEGNLLSPMVLSRATNLHPVTVLLAILLGAGLLGLMGALLAVPVTALGKVIIEDYLLAGPAYQE